MVYQIFDDLLLESLAKAKSDTLLPEIANRNRPLLEKMESIGGRKAVTVSRKQDHD